MVFFKETRCFAGVDVRTRCLQKRSTNLESLGSLGIAVMANLLQRCRSWNIHRIRGVKEKCFKTRKRKTGVCEWTNGIRFPVRASYLTWSH